MTTLSPGTSGLLVLLVPGGPSRKRPEQASGQNKISALARSAQVTRRLTRLDGGTLMKY